MNQKRRLSYLLTRALIGVLAITLAGCSDDDSDTDGQADEAYTLQMLHFADIDGAPGAVDEVDRFSALVDHFRQQYPDNTLVVSSGDNIIPGPRFYAAADESLAPELGVPDNGRADIDF